MKCGQNLEAGQEREEKTASTRTNTGDGWSFETKDGFKLAKHSDTPIIRHTKVQDSRSPFDGDWTYWGQRLSEYSDLTSRKQKLLKRQKGKCTHCGLHFLPDDITEIDHITPKVEGGKGTYDNLQLLHKHCHDEKTALDIEQNQTLFSRVKQLALENMLKAAGINDNDRYSEEPCDGKLSRTVLKER